MEIYNDPRTKRKRLDEIDLLVIVKSMVKPGVFSENNEALEITSRCMTAFLLLGRCSLVDVQVIEIKKHLRGQGLFRQFLIALIKELKDRQHLRFSNVVNRRFEHFLINIGFDLHGESDYVLNHHQSGMTLNLLEGVG
jgi:hypothetical protein